MPPASLARRRVFPYLLLLVLIPWAIGAKELLSNGGFEISDGEGWSTYAVATGVNTSAGIVHLGNARSGTNYAFLGDMNPAKSHARGVVRQDVDIPDGTINLTLTFWLSITSDEGIAKEFDTFGAYLRDFEEQVLATFAERSNQHKDLSGNAKNYQIVTQTIPAADFAGRRLILQFYAQTDDSAYTTFRVDDVSLDAEVITPPEEHEIRITAGEHGKVVPEGVQTVVDGGELSVIATPDAGYQFDRWNVDGQARHAGVATLTLTDIRGGHTVEAWFRPKTYRLELRPMVGGAIELDPPGPEYPQGTIVTARFTANPDRFFAGWTGDGTGLAERLQIPMLRDFTLGATFVPVPAPANFRIAHSTPMTLAELPGTAGFLYIIQKSFDLCCWRDITVREGEAGLSLPIAPPATATDRTEFTRTTLCQKLYLEPFLRFPLQGLKPNTVKVTALFDHHGQGPYRTDTVISTCNGDVVALNDVNGHAQETVGGVEREVAVTPKTFDPSIHKQLHLLLPPASAFDLPFRFDASELWYDGHPGYDFSVKANGIDTYTTVVAAAGGWFVPGKSDTCYHEICLEHKNGLRTFYLHLSKWEPKLEQAKLNNDTQVWVEAGEKIGEPGGWGCNAGQPAPDRFAKHLHFEVQRPDPLSDNKWEQVDPYGTRAQDGSSCEPVLWLPPDSY